MRRVLAGDDPVVVWGSGDQIRDFIHIKDVCRMAAELHEHHGGGTYNLGTGTGTSFRQLARMAGRVARREVHVVNDASKPEGVFARYADTTKTAGLGVLPRISLWEGIRNWMESHR